MPRRAQERVIANLAVISNFLAGRGSYKAAAAAPVDELAADLPRLLQVCRIPSAGTNLNPGYSCTLSGSHRSGHDRGCEHLQELMPFMPEVAREVLPQLVERLISRITARALRDVYVS